MHIHELKRKHPLKKKRQVGRGGKRGKTSGRGTKGQKSRAGRKLRPEIRDTIKKIPKLRGYRFNAVPDSSALVNVGSLEKIFSAGDTITATLLVDKKLVRRVRGKIPFVKVLGTGTLTKKLSLKNMTVSASARTKIEKVGGEILS